MMLLILMALCVAKDVLILKYVVTTNSTVNTSVLPVGEMSGVSLEHFWDCLHLLFLHSKSGACSAGGPVDDPLSILQSKRIIRCYKISIAL